MNNMMNNNERIKYVLLILASVLLFIGLSLIFASLTMTAVEAGIAMLGSFFITMVVYIKVSSIVFKDYIKEFNKNKEKEQ